MGKETARQQNAAMDNPPKLHRGEVICATNEIDEKRHEPPNLSQAV